MWTRQKLKSWPKFKILGGPYSAFAGHDASRGLATFEVQKVSDEPDDLSDLKPSELEQVIIEAWTLVKKLIWFSDFSAIGFYK